MKCNVFNSLVFILFILCKKKKKKKNNSNIEMQKEILKNDINTHTHTLIGENKKPIH